jgi:transglutaminase-like putative cysteine protease
MQGYEGALGWVRRRVDGVPATSTASVEAVRAVEHRVAMAAAFYPGRALCLEQSLALYLLLRRRGVAVRYRQGVQSHPFQAHAWVEYRGEVINDVAEHTERFTPFPDQLP